MPIPKKHLSLILFTVSLSITVKAQITPLQKDSLLRIISNLTEKEKIKSLDKLFKYYINTDIDSAGYYAGKLKIIAENTGDEEYLQLSYKRSGTYYFKSGQFLKAEEIYKKLADIMLKKKSAKKLAEAYKELSRINYFNNNLEKSAEYTHKSLKIYENLNDKQGIISALSNLASLYSASGNYKKALKYYFSALSSSDTVSDFMKIKLFHNIGSQYKRLNIPDSALYFYFKSLKISKKHDLKTETASNYYNIGDLYGYYIKNKDSALYYLNKASGTLPDGALNLRKAIYAAIGKTYFENKEYDKSITYLKKSLNISEKLHNLNGKEVANYFLYSAYKNKGNYKKSVYYLEKYIDAKDSVKYEKANIKLKNLRSEYENEKNKLKIKNLKEKRKADKKINHMLISLIILSVMIFAAIIISLLLNKKKNNLEKELLKTEKEKLNEEIKHKTRELTSQALMMLQKNKLLEEILNSLSEIKTTGKETHKEISDLKRRLKYSMHSEKDWKLFKQYFEEINKNFFESLNKINKKITPAEMKLAALIKLRFSIKETASLLNISEGSVKTARYNLRKKLGLKRNDNIYDYLNSF